MEKSPRSNGKFHGPWPKLAPGRHFVSEDFSINNRDVTRPLYLKAARNNPGWPQYARETKRSGCPPRSGVGTKKT